MDHAILVKNAVSTVRTIKTFGSRVVYSTVNVASGQGPTLPELVDLRVYRVNRLATRQTAEREHRLSISTQA
jgi:hypothetical protein